MPRAALLELHNTGRADTHPMDWPKGRFKVVLMPEGHSEDFDEEGTRRWLWPHLGRDYHLVEFVNVEEITDATR